MTTFLVSRHPGAMSFLIAQGFEGAVLVAHLDTAIVHAGDTVVGTLPAHLVATICEAGGRYFHLALDLPEELRGRELSVEEMKAAGAALIGIDARFVRQETD